MHHEMNMPSVPAPAALFVFVAMGVSTWGYSTLVKASMTVASHAESARMIAQAGVPVSQMSWADLGQTIGGVFSLLGIVVAGYTAIRGRLAKAANQRENDRRFDAGITDVRLYLAQEMAKVEVEHARHHAELMERLGQQDQVLEQVRSAATTPAEPPKPPA